VAGPDGIAPAGPDGIAVAGSDPVALARSDPVAVARSDDVGDIVAGADQRSAGGEPADHQSAGDEPADHQPTGGEPADHQSAGDDPADVGADVGLAERPAVAERLTRAGAVGLPADPGSVQPVRLADVGPVVGSVRLADIRPVVADGPAVAWPDQTTGATPDTVPNRRDADSCGARLTLAGRRHGPGVAILTTYGCHSYCDQSRSPSSPGRDPGTP
jgi:hypothetical protein